RGVGHMLRGGGRDLPARQRTLRSTIEWSTELLTAAQRRVLQLFSVFVGARTRSRARLFPVPPLTLPAGA
ncbi:MAG TPA: hypothetical protein VE462_00720, partial [Propionibacteriaceae bacterium]|nr:hypothetical protein [Propionibacteriaceae bacterium]